MRKPISQIVNLNAETEQNINQQDAKNFIRGQIRDTDSNYIKLAKSGGHKHLLHYQECKNKTQEPVAYPIVEWYYDNEPDTEQKDSKKDNEQGKTLQPYKRPEWMTYLEYDINPKYSPASRVYERSIIGFDNMSMWKREEMEKQMQLAEEKSKQKRELRRKRKAQNKQTEESVTTKSKLKLPDPSKRQLPGTSRFSRSSYAERWYHKWYLGAISGTF